MPEAGRYTLITGEYQIRHGGKGQQSRPDGDTLDFIVDQPATVMGLRQYPGQPPNITFFKGIDLRLEIIDALETHYPSLNGSGPEVRQQTALAHAARDFLLKALGFSHVKFDARGVVVSADAFRVRGHVLANRVESRGRVVALLYAGPAPSPDGTQVKVTPEQLRGSVNMASLAQGMAYATHYESQPQELVLVSRALAAQARASGLGVFGAEEVGVQRAAAIESLDELQKLVFFPKLFRRLADYFAETQGSLAGFDKWVRSSWRRDDKLILPNGEVGNLHDVYQVKDQRLSLRVQPEDLLVLEP